MSLSTLQNVESTGLEPIRPTTKCFLDLKAFPLTSVSTAGETEAAA